jgi:regulatory protein
VSTREKPSSINEQRASKRLDQSSIEAKALAYLDKFDASASRLKRVLEDFVKRRAAEQEVEAGPYLQIVRDVLERYQQNGLIDDRRYAAAMARGLLERGASRQAVKAKLHGRGISTSVIDDVVRELGTQGGDELSAARALVRKRRLGNLRPEAERRESYRRDLGILARAGFDFDTAKRALSVEGVEGDEGF